MAWNQLLRNGNFTSQSNWGSPRNCTVSVSNNVFTMTCNTSGDNYSEQAYEFNTIGDKYYVSMEYRSNTANTTIAMIFHGNAGNYDTWYSASAQDLSKGTSLFTRKSGMFTMNVNQYHMIRLEARDAGVVNQFRNVMIMNLTKIYGKGNEPSTATEFENDYFKWFGKTLTFEDYDAGSIRNTKVNALKTVGFNIFNAQSWYSYAINNSKNNCTTSINGETITLHATGNDPYFCSVLGANTKYTINQCGELMKVLPSTDYYFGVTGNITTPYINFFDSTLMSWGYTSKCNAKLSIPNNVCYISVRVGNASGSAGNDYSGKYCISIYDSALNGTYEAYEDRTYSIPITSITGKLNGTGNSVVVFPEGMKSAGSVADEIVVEGGVTKAIKRVGSVDLGTLNWIQMPYSPTGDTSFWANSLSTDIPTTSASNYYSSGCTCTKYYNVSGRVASYMNDKEIGVGGWTSSCGKINIHDTDLSNKTGDQVKSILNGIILNYELETLQVYVLDNFNMPINIKCWKSGTERYESSEMNGTSPKLIIHYNSN